MADPAGNYTSSFEAYDYISDRCIDYRIPAYFRSGLYNECG